MSDRTQLHEMTEGQQISSVEGVGAVEGPEGSQFSGVIFVLGGINDTLTFWFL